jgi:putative DNA primase/helicase
MLRCSYKVWEPETKQNQAAMLAIFSDHEGTAITIHRTYLGNDGNKLNIDSPKKILPPLKPMKGGSVRLYDLEGDTLGITEGIETAIAVHESFSLPVWASLSTSLLESFIPPAGVRQIIIFGDNDENYAGQKSAYILANKLVIKYKIGATVELPECTGDWLDEKVRLTASKREAY